MSDYSREALLSFLKEAALAGRINPATARSRRNAAQELLVHLTDAEAADLREVDISALAARCYKSQGSTVRPEVLEIYVERLRHALTDFIAFLDAPDAFQSIGRERRERRARSADGARPEEEEALEQVSLRATDYQPEIVPVRLRPDAVVYLHGLPADLTAAEAERIARVLRALVEPTADAS